MIKELFFVTALLLVASPLWASMPQVPEDFIPTHHTPSKTQKKLLKREDSLGEYYKLKLAESLIKKGHTIEALKFINRSKAPEWRFWKQVLNAEVFLKQKKFREVIATLKKLPATPQPSISFGENFYHGLYKRALLARHQAKKSLGQRAIFETNKLLSLFPKDQNLQKLITKNKFTATDKINLLHALHFRYDYKNIEGLITTREIQKAKVSKDTKCRAFYELGRALRTRKNGGDEAVLSLESVLKKKCSNDWQRKALYWLGSTRPDKLPDKREFYLKQFIKKNPKHRLTDDAHYKLYKIAKSQKSPKQSKHLSNLLNADSGDMRMTYYFHAAFSHYKKKRYHKAAQTLKKSLKAKPTFDESYPKNLYWYARSLEQLKGKKNQELSKESYSRLVKEFPFSFYAVLASQKTKERLKIPTLPKLDPTIPSENTEDWALVDLFIKNGSAEAARALLDSTLHQYPEWQNKHTHALTYRLIQVGNYRKAIDMASKHFDSAHYAPVQLIDDPMFSAFYPLAYREQIQTGYRATKLPRGTIEGIMREESLFQKDAVSHAGATGLMQLMPSTAQLVKSKIAGSAVILDDLTHPQSNILLGSNYLKNMIGYFQNQLPLAIMAYNAGPGNVNKWLRRFGHLPLDEFIENVPFNETRNYVKRVLRTMTVYGNFYKEPYFQKESFVAFEIQRKSKQMPRKKRRR